MGCDIHLYVEVCKDGKWQTVHEWKEEDDDGYSWFHVVDRHTYDVGRNYRLFAMLANVRNGYGFAGIDTGDALVPISMPKGLPDDVAIETKKCSDGWGVDGHSHSWLTVRELMEYDWTQQVENRGVVHAVEYWKWTRWDREQGEGPENWSGDVSGGRVQYLTEPELSVAIEKAIEGVPYQSREKIIEERFPQTYCRVYWKTPYYKMARYFLSDTLPQLWRVGSPDDVRIVFWFDN